MCPHLSAANDNSCEAVLTPCSAAFAHCSRMREDFLRLVHHRAAFGDGAAAAAPGPPTTTLNSLLAVLCAACLAAVTGPFSSKVDSLSNSSANCARSTPAPVS